MAALCAGCGDLVRDNPLDPAAGVTALRDELVGSWSHESADRNEIYVFMADPAVELWEFSSPSGGSVDRSAPWPETRVRIYTGTYQLTGNILGLSFTQAQSNDPDDAVSVPATRISVEITISRDTLTFDKTGGKVYYTRSN